MLCFIFCEEIRECKKLFYVLFYDLNQNRGGNGNYKRSDDVLGKLRIVAVSVYRIHAMCLEILNQKDYEKDKDDCVFH